MPANILSLGATELEWRSHPSPELAFARGVLAALYAPPRVLPDRFNQRRFASSWAKGYDQARADIVALAARIEIAGLDPRTASAMEASAAWEAERSPRTAVLLGASTARGDVINAAGFGSPENFAAYEAGRRIVLSKPQLTETAASPTTREAGS